MNLQGRNLSLNMRGSDVTLLIEELRTLHFDIPSEETHFGAGTRKAVISIQRQEQLEPTGIVDEATAAAINRLFTHARVDSAMNEMRVARGQVRDYDGRPFTHGTVRAFDLDLRKQEELGHAALDAWGRYEIRYGSSKFARAEKRSADLVVRVFAADARELAASPVWYNAPASADVDLTLPAATWDLPTLFESVGHALAPILDGLEIVDLDQRRERQDLTFLAGETGLGQDVLVRFVLAHRLAARGIQAEFWFSVLGDPAFPLTPEPSLADAMARVLDRLQSLDAERARKSLARSFQLQEISEAFREMVPDWLEAFRQLMASRSVDEASASSFMKAALDEAGISGSKRAQFARFLGEHRGLTPEMAKRLEDAGFRKEEVADLQASFQLAALTQGSFSTVRAIREAFNVREPEQLRDLARRSEGEWVELVTSKHAAGELDLPIATGEDVGRLRFPDAALYGRTLARRFREAFPTAAFGGSLNRALRRGALPGFQHGKALDRLLERHPEFELLRTSVDEFLDGRLHPDLRDLAGQDDFRLELKAVQRIFKLAPAFEATVTLMKDRIHAGQQIYRLGEGEFVSRYGTRAGFTAETARETWKRSADSYAAVLTIVGDLKALEGAYLPSAIRHAKGSVTKFPNWNNLFQTGDFCECEHCRSVLGPAAYFADLLMFLRDRPARTGSVKDVLFSRRPDLGYLELNCENGSVALPYIDVANEVLEAAIAAGRSDRELAGFTAMPANPVTAKKAIFSAFENLRISLGADFSHSQIDPGDPDRWVIHGDAATYLLKKKTTPNFFAEILRNTKATAAELRAYPQYVDPTAYAALRQARFPFALPFDLYSEEVRASFRKVNLQRWELMRDLRGPAPRNSAGNGDVAADYFGISVDPAAPFDEKRLILVADASVAGQQALWGETGNATWLNVLANVSVFLRKAALEYNDLLALLDLPFIDPAGDLAVNYGDDPTCDTERQRIQPLDPARLDRIHRFLRLWRKLKGWQMWELDLAIRHPAVGAGSLDEKCLFKLYQVSEVRRRLGGKVTLEETLGLLGNLNVETRFTKPFEKRADGLYQTLFLNRKLVFPIDPAFAVAAVDVAPPTAAKISAHRPALLAALGIQESDLAVLTGLRKASDGQPYISDDLTLTNLSFLWRHAWLARQLKWKPEEWKAVLALTNQDLARFGDPQNALDFLKRAEDLKATGFTPVELAWLLAANRSARSAAKESDAAAFLRGLRKWLQDIRTAYDPEQYDFLVAAPPESVEPLEALVGSLLAELGRTDEEASLFLATLRGQVILESRVDVVPSGFAFAAAVTGPPASIPITHDAAGAVFRFTGVMTGAQRTSLLDNTGPSIAALGVSAQLEADAQLPGGFTFPGAITGAPNNISIQYDQANTALRFAGLMTDAQRTVLLNDPTLAAVTGDAGYRAAIASLSQQSLRILTGYRQAIEDLYEQSLNAPATFATTEVKVSSPVTLPAPYPSLPIRYDAGAGVVGFTGVMTDAERLALKAIAANPAGAIDEVYWSPRLAVRFFEAVFTTPLAGLPPSIDFSAQLPAALAGRVTYDEEERRLQYTGILDAEALSTLQALAPGTGALEVAYQKALSDLALQPQTIAATDARVWLSDSDLDATRAASDTLPKRLATAARKAMVYRSKTQSIEAVIAAASAQLGLSEGITRLLATRYPLLPDTLLAHLTGPFVNSFGVVDASTLKDTFNVWYWAIRAAALLKKWNVTVKEVEQIAALAPNAKLLNLGALPLDASGAVASLEEFLRTSRLVQLRNGLPERGIALLQLLTKVNERKYAAEASVTGLPTGFTFPASITGAPHNIAIVYDESATKLVITGLLSVAQRATLLNDSSLAPVTGNPTYQQAIQGMVDRLNQAFATDVALLNDAWTAEDVLALVQVIDLAYPADYLLAESWERLRKVFSFVQALNAGVKTLTAFAGPALSEADVATLKHLLRSKLGAETWLTVCAEIQDVLRERKRDALCAYLLTQPRPADAPSGKWENANDLYSYYLLDVEMGACQLTSRLVQASGSVQLLVQRCFMGLEPNVAINEDPVTGGTAWRWWAWMRKYRVWEANRKIFLWPENWIEPELRRDKSELFRDLENELLQEEMEQSTGETAILNYLARLNEIARLEVAAFYQEDAGDDTIIHVFGRTPGGEPHQHYYRRYEYGASHFGRWTPWERIELDIQGEYLIPAVIARRLFLFWPVFTQVQDETANSQVTVPPAGATKFTPDKPKKRLRMQMAVSEYRQPQWTPKRVSTSFVESDAMPPHSAFTGDIDTRAFGFYPIDRTEVGGEFAIKYQGQALDANSVRERRNSLSLPLTVRPGNAALYGQIEFSGCNGVHDAVFRPADSTGWFERVQHVVPVETASVGGDVFGPVSDGLKWVERSVRYDSYLAGTVQDDFTIDNFLAVSPIPYSTPLLERTPGTFTMTPAWHGSYVDRLWWFGPEPSREWVGAGLPFFYADKNRTYFVLTAGSRTLGDGSVTRMYYPDIKLELRAWERTYEGEVSTWLDSFVSNLTMQERDDLTSWFAYSRKAPLQPPYSDAQLKSLVAEVPRLATRRYLKGRADALLQDSRFHFKNFYHPLTCDFGRLANDPLKGLPALFSRDTQLRQPGFRFYNTYGPTAAVVDPTGNPQDPHSPFFPREEVDFDRDGAYSSYNWELFFHAPLLIANSLRRNQRFEEARNWYHYIFNPLGVAGGMGGGSPMSKFWITRPFFETTDQNYLEQRIDSLLRILAGDQNAPGFNQAIGQVMESVTDWRTHPFEPHRIASYRTVAYQKTVVMKYIDNLVAWGDYLFRQDSMESINEATQLYVMAAEILGERPRIIPPRLKPPVETFNELEQQFDLFSNALVQAENLVPVMPGTGTVGSNQPPLPTLYFCIPQNEKLLAHWDTVADRLYKVRHCMNIEGVVRQLPLFEPPIDPAALVKAVAGGADLGAALADLNAPLPLYRSRVLLQKANDVCGDVKALGGALLAALEKKDAEALGLLRQTQEIRLLDAVRGVRQHQIDEARETLEGLKKNKELVTLRRDFYRDIERISASERLHQDKLKRALAAQQIAQVMSIAASIAHIVPAFDVGGAGAGGSPRAGVSFGGPNIGSALQATAGGFTFIAELESYHANKASIDAGHDRRWEDWKFQESLANKELEQLDKSIAAAELRVTITEKELANQVLQIDQARETDAFLRSKYTNGELYQWQIGQISSVYFQSYKLAYDLAKRAERCCRFELGLRDSSYINFGHWDSLRKGLLSGEKLQYDLRRLETAYLDQNRREYELTKHVSLALLDPLALIRLRETGRCFFRLPEEIFDRDYPGHYFRRIKSVSISVPSVVGPYTTISCTLRLLKNSIRINTANGDNGYPRNVDDQGLPADDMRFIENNVPVKATAASGAQNDSGMFEMNFQDERYLPFEGAGAVSEWALELFSDLPSNNPDPGNPDFGRPLRQYDYDTLADVVLHVRYTAREDAGPFKNGAIAHLREYFSESGSTRSLRAFSLRQEFPTQWARFLHPASAASGNVLELKMAPDLFVWKEGEPSLKINTLWLLARCTDPGGYSATISPPLPAAPAPPATDSHRMTLVPIAQYGGLHFSQKDVSALNVEVARANPPATWAIRMARPDGGNLQTDLVKNVSEVDDLFLILGYEWPS